MYSAFSAQERYAIYFSPRRTSMLFQLGTRWLGRDPISGEQLDPMLAGSLDHEEWRLATDRPRRYGFHATLKPPFYLTKTINYSDLGAAIRAFAANRAAFIIPPLRVRKLGRFLALVLSEPSSELHKLGSDCVTEFDRFRAVSDEPDVEPHLSLSLSARERHNFRRWGYPYVFDTWTFHMTLTGSLAPQSLLRFQEILEHRFAPVADSAVLIDSIGLFREPTPDGQFLLLEEVNLGDPLLASS